MEFTIDRDVFLAGIKKTLGIVDKKATMPILSNLLLRTAGHEDAGIEIVATDLEIGLVAGLEASIIAEGRITLSALILFEMVRELQGETVHVLSPAAASEAVLTCNKAVCKLRGIPADDYPDMDDHEDPDLPFFKIKASALKELIRKVSFAISTDETRPAQNGVFFEKEIPADTSNVSMMRMGGTDGHRLSMARMKMEESDISIPGIPRPNSAQGIIIPRKGLSEIRKMIEEEADDILVGSSPGFLVVKNAHSSLRISLIAGEYPDYRRVIPEEKGEIARIGKDSILHSLRRMKVINAERVVITIAKGIATLNSIHPDWGECKDEIEAAWDGEERTVSFNVKLLMDAIEVIDEPTIDFEIREKFGPGVIRGSGNDNYFCLVMPLRN